MNRDRREVEEYVEKWKISAGHARSQAILAYVCTYYINGTYVPSLKL